MIATVRIAPMERWCEPAKRYSKLPRGLEINIHTESCFDYGDGFAQGCGGKAWIVEREWSKRRHEALGIPVTYPHAVCEHMLELD